MKSLVLVIATASAVCAAHAQIEVVHPGTMLDPSRAVKQVHTVGTFHQPLPEQYIWTANDAAVATGEKQLSQLKRDDWHVAPHDFRRGFDLTAKPERATLYLAGPRAAKVWINGKQVADLHYTAAHHMGFGTMTADISSALKPGANTIAIEAIRGYGSHHHTNAQKTAWLNSGEVLVAKILPAAEGIEVPALLVTDAKWKSSLSAGEGWQQPAFDDAQWQAVAALGGIESSIDFFQWNADAGMYNWPGYLGEAPYMANYLLEPASVKQIPQGTLLDFGRELNGRIYIPASPQAGSVRVQLGESMGELINAPYLGELTLTAPANTAARGPKTGFRYALIRTQPDQPQPTVLAEGIYYPAPQIGTFESSDPLVNKIFETAVYTAHLSMQDSILDGIKRDRGRWIGDDEVINRVALDIYGNVPQIKEGLEDAIGPEPVTEPVNGLPGYSAWWVVAEYEYIQRTGDLGQLHSVKTRMVELLNLMQKDLDSRNIYAGKGKPFVDWANGFSGDSPDARRAVHYEYMRAFSDASQLLQLAGSKVESRRYLDLAVAMRGASSQYLQDSDEGVGDRWQTNAAAVLVSVPTDHPWPPPFAVDRVMDRTTKGRKATDVITPYYGSYMLDALSDAIWPEEGDGSTKAMEWMKSYWGGMLENGATSFWEAWDSSWAGSDPHAKLEADDKVGYNASLSHGWSSGPAAWLLEQVLGVREVCWAGGNRLQIHPHLAGLQWARGTVASSAGPVQIEVSRNRIYVSMPAGITGNLVMPGTGWLSDQVKIKKDSEVQMDGGRSYEFTRR